MATLKNLVDETTNIKDELVECHTTLKNNLIEKGVECSEEDKMLDLINMVKDLSNYKSIAGTSMVLAAQPSKYTCPASYTHFYSYEIKFSGGLRVTWYMQNFVNGNSAYKAHLKFELVRNNVVIKTFEHKHHASTLTQDFTDIHKGDIIKFFGGTNYNPYGYIQDISITCDLI